MAIEIIDGTLEAAVLKRAYAKVSMYDRITIRTTAGEERRLEKVAVAPDVAALLQPGTDGRSVYAVPNGNERTMLMTTIIGWISFVFFILVGKGIGLLALALGVLGGIGWFRYRKTRIEGRALYEADSGFA